MDLTITAVHFTGLILRAAASFCSCYLGILFFSKIKRARGSGVDLSPFFGLGIFFLLGGIATIFFSRLLTIKM